LRIETNTVTVSGATTTTMFDRALGTLTRTSPTGRTTVTTLDAHGRVVASSVPGLSRAAFTYELEHLASVTQAGRTTSYAYDAPPGQPAHLFTYTPVNLVESYSAPPPAPGELPSTTTYAYDLDRKLTGATRPDGSLFAYGYDAIGRLRTVTHPSLGVLSYAYDPQGRLATIGGPDGVLNTHGYDGHLLTDVAWSGAITGPFHRDFDNFFRPSGEKVNGAPVATFARAPVLHARCPSRFGLGHASLVASGLERLEDGADAADTYCACGALNSGAPGRFGSLPPISRASRAMMFRFSRSS
jgi:YD repeat-containing protein